MPTLRIHTINNANDERLLRRRASEFDFARYTKAEITALIAALRTAMITANGIGLAASQAGLDIRVFVARVNNKFYAVFNPVIAEMSASKETADEGCLSVPGVYGATPRATGVTLKGFDRGGRAIKVKAWGLLARVFQHEVDHLNGVLFIDKAKETHAVAAI